MTHSNFITNQNTLVSTVVNQYMEITDRIDILVGYFYFSGFREIYSNLKDKKVRILVGMEVEQSISAKVAEFESDKTNISNLQKQENYYSQLVKTINNTETFDKKDISQSWQIFVDKIKEGTLEIRKTNSPNHSKLYLFNLNETEKQNHRTDGILITGSSNLTYSGLTGRLEANVILDDNTNYTEANKFFEDLWRDSIQLVNGDLFTKFEESVIKKVWINNICDPYIMYLRVLIEYFGTHKTDSVKTANSITGGEFMDLSYQTEAVQKSLEIIENHNGVIIADVVGLGKSIIGSVVAHNLNLQNTKLC